MPLTNEEREGIDQLLARKEKTARSWRLGRWIQLVGGLFQVGLAVSLYVLAEKSRWMAIQPHSQSAWERVDLLHISSAMLFSQCLTLSIMMGVLAIRILGPCLARWNKARDDLLLIKLARLCLDNQRPCPAEEDSTQQESTRQPAEGDNP